MTRHQRKRDRARRSARDWRNAIQAKVDRYRTVRPPARGTNRDPRFVSPHAGWQQIARYVRLMEA